MKKWEESLKDIVFKHGCENCWSDIPGCHCNEERNAMLSLKSFISKVEDEAYSRGVTDTLNHSKEGYVTQQELNRAYRLSLMRTIKKLKKNWLPKGAMVFGGITTEEIQYMDNHEKGYNQALNDVLDILKARGGER